MLKLFVKNMVLFGKNLIIIFLTEVVHLAQKLVIALLSQAIYI